MGAGGPSDGYDGSNPPLQFSPEGIGAGFEGQ
jgi:hypothetical protein